jgi:hypothetical protein
MTPTPEWLRRLLIAIRPLLPREFVGSIELNVFRGGIANVNVRQSFQAGDREDGVRGDSGRLSNSKT